MVYVSERAYSGNARIGASSQMEGPPEQPECKVYIGNMDSRLTEQIMLKILQKVGEVVRLRFIWHTAGPKKGEPAGFCFAEFATVQVAVHMIVGTHFPTTRTQQKLFATWTDGRRLVAR